MTQKRKLKREYVTHEVFMHNALLGHVAMCDAQMKRIIDAQTTTELAKTFARDVRLSLAGIKRELAVRVDPESAYQDTAECSGE